MKFMKIFCEHRIQRRYHLQKNGFNKSELTDTFCIFDTAVFTANRICNFHYTYEYVKSNIHLFVNSVIAKPNFQKELFTY